jgi:hypothetical protein
MFKKTSSRNTETIKIKKTPMDFKSDIENDAVVWGVDPGVTNVFTAVDSSSCNKPERIRLTSSKEYYHLCGFNTASREREEHRKIYPEDSSLLLGLPTLKTPDITK